MTGRDAPSLDPDDWFADPDRAPSRRARPPAKDDWTAAPPRPRRQAGELATYLPERWRPIAAAGVLVAILLVAGLAVAGVFDSTPSSAVATTPTLSTPTTTATTTVAQAPAPSVPAPTTTLKPGDTGAQVKRLQRALAQLGYTAGKADGDYGATTKTAVAAFQTASKLTSDGVFGPATRAALVKALNAG